MYLNKLAIRQNMTLLLCWRYSPSFCLFIVICAELCCCSNKEVARYLETYVLFENRSADPIRERSKDDYDEQACTFFTNLI
mgnify:CR=1 FL=1